MYALATLLLPLNTRPLGQLLIDIFNSTCVDYVDAIARMSLRIIKVDVKNTATLHMIFLFIQVILSNNSGTNNRYKDIDKRMFFGKHKHAIKYYCVENH